MRYKYSDICRYTNGDVIPSATISLFLAGTTTPAKMYTTSTSDTVVYSVTSDSTGQYTFYVDAFDYGSFQTFKLEIAKGGYPSQYIDNILMEDVVIGNYTITAARTCNYPIHVPHGVVFVYGASGARTLTFNKTFTAGAYQIFSGFSTGITFGRGSLESIMVEWWGGSADNSTDNTSAFASAITVCQGSRVPIKLLSGNYLVNITINTTNPVIIRGCGHRDLTVLKPYLDSPVITFDSASASIVYGCIENLTLTDNSFGNIGIAFTGTGMNDHHLINNVYIGGGFEYGIKVSGRWIWNTLINVVIDGCTKSGLYVIGADTYAVNQNTFINLVSNNNTEDGATYEHTSLTSTNGFMTESFYSCNFESNKRHGFYLNGGAGGGFAIGPIFVGCYFEANEDVGMKISGLFCIGVTIKGCILWFNTNYDLYVDATLFTGLIDSNRFAGAVTIATSHVDSSYSLMNNYGGTITEVPDPVTYSTSNFPTNGLIRYFTSDPMSAKNVRIISSLHAGTTETINNITDAVPGQFLTLYLENTGRFLVKHDPTKIYLRDAKDLLMSQGDSLTLWYSTSESRWFECGRNIGSVISRATSFTISSGAATLDDGYHQYHTTLTEDITSITFPTPYVGQSIAISFTQNNSAAKKVCDGGVGWPADVLLAGGAFTMTATLSKTDVLVFEYNSVLAQWLEKSRSQNL